MDHRLRSLHAGRRRCAACAPRAQPRGSAGAHRGRSLAAAGMNTPRARPWPAPAKLNLFLHILGRRTDGYHELQTCFQFVDLCDEISFDIPADGRIRRITPMAGVAEDADLCVRTARLLQAAAGCRWGAD